MTLWKVTVVARHRARSAKAHRDEDTLISYLYTRTRKAGERWAVLERGVVQQRYDAQGGDFYWGVEADVETTTEFKAPVRPRRWKGWPAMRVGRRWFSRREPWRELSKAEAHRRNRISRTSRQKRAARERAEAAIPELPTRLNVFHREFKPYTEYDALAPEPGLLAYEETEADERTIERLNEEYDELEAGGSPGGVPSDA